jgi:hypothetical protein
MRVSMRPPDHDGIIITLCRHQSPPLHATTRQARV